ncbi:hypothetical protein PGTUg99_028000 [Puccinia graminis f. sp. tritici]|uniref:Uncharacterized protein n=1 Tax=Puccinia graminis f. sp. tritici TaxID=56615 RepID=A0A5B0RU16_PUCGR|nr:hypothetical protein PGTUg99_028000 [Puccinia graminis f. sp. tritici]
MIVEDERELVNLDNFYDGSGTVNEVNIERSDTRSSFSQFFANFHRLRSKAGHVTLRNDLIAHLWQLKG